MINFTARPLKDSTSWSGKKPRGRRKDLVVWRRSAKMTTSCGKKRYMLREALNQKSENIFLHQIWCPQHLWSNLTDGHNRMPIEHDIWVVFTESLVLNAWRYIAIMFFFSLFTNPEWISSWIVVTQKQVLRQQIQAQQEELGSVKEAYEHLHEKHKQISSARLQDDYRHSLGVQ